MGKKHLLRKATILDYDFYHDYYVNGFKCFLTIDETHDDENSSDITDFISLEDLDEFCKYDEEIFASKKFFEKLITSSTYKCFIVQNGTSEIGFITLSKTANIWRIDEWQMDEAYQNPPWIEQVVAELLSNLKDKTIDVNLISPMAIKIFKNLGFINSSSIFFRKENHNVVLPNKKD